MNSGHPLSLRQRLSIGTILISLLMATISWYYLNDVWAGIQKHTPPCAPIRGSTVLIFYAFTGVAALAAAAAIALSWRNRWRTCCALLVLVANLTACATWAHWNTHERLLPYAEFCAKTGMP